MGGRISQLKGSRPQNTAQEPKGRGEVIDISVRSAHSRSSNQGRGERGASDANAVLDSIMVDEAEVGGREAAVTAGLEAMDSGGLGEGSRGVHSQAARALEEARQSRYDEEEWDPNDRHADGSTHDGHVRRKASMHGSRSGRSMGRSHRESGQPAKPAASPAKRMLWHLRDYFLRMRGGLEEPPKIPELLDIARGWVGAFSSILIISVLRKWATPDTHFDFLVASFGASAVLVFGACEGKLAQPRNLIGGQVVSAVVGCTVRLILKKVLWLSSAVGMAISLSVMQLTKTLHPPGGATALIASSAPNPLPIWAGYSIVLVVFIDSLIMLVIGLLVNNSWRGKRYPTYWW